VRLSFWLSEGLISFAGPQRQPFRQAQNVCRGRLEGPHFGRDLAVRRRRATTVFLRTVGELHAVALFAEGHADEANSQSSRRRIADGLAQSSHTDRTEPLEIQLIADEADDHPPTLLSVVSKEDCAHLPYASSEVCRSPRWATVCRCY
jgi:hypothetical protein